eukprot:CAMPEP_0195285526 /NCGR_PEP_ID=MMETSP0707-20130614/3325_1 /TAXON_ID=33640 /ORGANISM="Asterionellopsis glacialis, Strain CCMP134" /LENGTH=817 /DNA_ID=CAMNT_0040345029 /DNA_START=337 /DNA_END=2790 /DNA_ORIENTATION=+
MPHPLPGTGSSQFSLDHIPTTDAEVDAAAALMSLPTFGSNRYPNNGTKSKSSAPMQQQHQQRGHSSSTAATSTTAGQPRFAFADDGVAPPSSATHIRNVCYSSDSSLSDLSYGVEPPMRNRSRSPPSTLEGGGARSTGGGSSKSRGSRGRKTRKKSPNRHKQQQPRFAFDDDQPRGCQQQMPNVRVTSYASDSSLSSYGDYDERVAHRRSNTRRQPSRTTNNGRAEYQESIEVELNPDSYQSHGNHHHHHHHGNTSGAVAPAGGRHIITPVATPASATSHRGVHEPRFELAGDSRSQYQQQGQYRNPTTYNSDSSISSYGRGDHGSAAGSVVSGAAAYINPAHVSIPGYNNNNSSNNNNNVNRYLATDAQMLANMKLDASYNSMPGAAVPAAPAATATSPRFSFTDEQHRQQQQQQQHPTVTVSRPRSNSVCDSSISSHGDDSSAAYSYGENLVAQAASSAGNKAPPSPGITCYPGSTSLALPGDDDILSPLHCFMRKYGVEAFSAEPDDVARPRYGKAHAARVVVGQVGIRCLHCKHRPVSERPERAVCYPSSLRNIYHSIETWQRKHSPACTDMPRAMKERLDGLINGSRKSAGGRRQYWEESAKKLGMVDTPAGVRFAREPGYIETEVAGGAPTFTPDGGGSSMSDLNMSQSSIPHTVSVPLVSPETDDTTLVSGFLFCLMSQMETCQFTEEDRAGNRSKVKDCPIGFPGMQCKHCRGVAGLGRYFPSSIDALALANSDRNICNHVMKCRKCPQEIKDGLLRLQQEQASGKHKQKRGSRKKFFTTIWDRIQHPHPHDGPSCTQPIGSSGIRALV